MLLCFKAVATRPTVHASNFSYSSLECNSVTLTWTNGNGAARLIVAKEGSAPTYVPADNVTYTGNPDFGTSLQYNTGNYVVYNANSANFVRIDSLEPGRTYYFTIYEHDNKGSVTQYYTNGAPSFSISTYSITPGFTVTYYDSCQAHNLYRFINTSKATAPDTRFYLDFGDGDTSSLDTVIHSYKISGLIPARMKAVTSHKGCNLVEIKPIRVYKKKVVYFNFSHPKTKDTVQAFYKNHFMMYTGNYTNPLSGSYAYRWFTETDTSIFSFFSHNYTSDGRHKVSLEITTNISKGPLTYPTGCKDTISFTVFVRNDALKSMMAQNGNTQSVDTNSFRFSNTDPSISSLTWLFGDGDSSAQDTVLHTYKDTGTYTVTLKAWDNIGDYHQKSMKVQVLPAGQTTSLNVLSTPLSFNIYPNPSSGKFTIDAKGQGIETIYVYNMLGGIVRELDANGRAMLELDLSVLTPGNYMVFTRTGHGMIPAMVHIQP